MNATNDNLLTMEQAKQCAILEYNQDAYFVFNGVAYLGDFDEIEMQYSDLEESTKNEVDLETYIIDNCEVVEDYEEHGDYLVCTNDEADELWDESLENYIDECIISELPKQYQNYFDREGWKSDARFDGRGHSLSSYDGCENEYNIDSFGETLYVYRIN